jgi:hypothetical protein
MPAVLHAGNAAVERYRAATPSRCLGVWRSTSSDECLDDTSWTKFGGPPSVSKREFWVAGESRLLFEVKRPLIAVEIAHVHAAWFPTPEGSDVPHA